MTQVTTAQWGLRRILDLMKEIATDKQSSAIATEAEGLLTTAADSLSALERKLWLLLSQTRPPSDTRSKTSKP